MKSNFYTREELLGLGLKSCGTNVCISRKCSLYSGEQISIGDHVRIDDFCILSGSITIGNYVHISAYSALYGRGGIEIGDFCGVSPRSTLLSASDDFSGEHMISPMVSAELTQLTIERIVMQKYCQIGAQSIVMPGVIFHEGAVCGAFSYVTHSLDPWSINVGIPCRKLRERARDILELAKGVTD